MSCPIATVAVPPLGGRVTGSAPQRKHDSCGAPAASYTHAVISGSWMQ